MAKKTNYEINGVKYYRKRVKIDGKQVLFLGESLTDVERQIEEYKSKPVDCSFYEVFNDWLNVIKKPELRPSSFNRYEIIYRLHISQASFLHKQLDQITDIDIQKLINGCESESQAKFIRDLLKSFFFYCQKTKKIIYNPMISVVLPKKSYKPPMKKCLNEEDISKLMALFKKDRSLFIYIFIFMTGLRNGEVCALHDKDVDLNTNTIKVFKSLNRVTVNGTNRIVESMTKTQSSIRDIYIPPAMIPLIKEHRAAQRVKYLKLGLKYKDDSYFFSSNLCTPLRGDRLSTRWQALQKENGIEPVTLHGLRHSFGTMLARKGVQIKVVSELMGHSDVSITQNIYTHVSTDQKEEAINELAKLLS